ncbi:MAG: DNA polymerase III subunit beta [Flavobacteriales bacterium]|nr:DNA polymerase III subunit beta [Flavobacteriales bacterium]
MKFLVNSQSLLKQLQLLSGVLSSNNTLPILDNFLFEISGKELKISASDLETSMSTRIMIEAKEDGLIAIPAKILLDTVKSFPEQPLTFTVDQKTFGIEISSDHGKYKLSGQNGEEFPKAPALDAAGTVEIEGDVLSTAISSTLFAAGNDELRPVMSGIFFELGSDSIRFVATDAHRLVRYTRTDATADQNASFIVPKKPLNLLKGISSTAETPVKMSFSASNAVFTFDNVELSCRLIEGKFPNYEAVIPNQNPNKLTIGRNDLLQSIRRVSIFANKTTHQVRLKINGSELTISAEDLDFANEANERLTCSYEGEDMEIGFNSRFLADMLSNVNSENIVLEMSASNRAGIIVPAENALEQEDILMLVMPVMLNN